MTYYTIIDKRENKSILNKMIYEEKQSMIKMLEDLKDSYNKDECGRPVFCAAKIRFYARDSKTKNYRSIEM